MYKSAFIPIKLVLTAFSLASLAACGGSGEGEGGGVHNAGVACAQCHNFKTSGTIFKTLNAPDHSAQVASGYSIRIQDSATGNSKNAFALGGEGGIGNFAFNANYQPSGDFIAIVLDPSGKEVNRSGIHSKDRIDCNGCHTHDGTSAVRDTRGAPGRIVNSKAALNPAAPPASGSNNKGTANTGIPTSLSFSKDVFPIFNSPSNCNHSGCHAINSPSALVKSFFVTTDDPAATLATIINQGLTKAGDANNSLLFQKPSMIKIHVGGNRLTGGNSDTVRNWINQGALDN